MHSKESSYHQYEQDNLFQRLKELKNGEPAYDLHTRTIIDTLLHVHELTENKQRVVDFGCGLGFLTKKLQQLSDKGILISGNVIGVDPSAESISIAKKEHPKIEFYPESTEVFAEMIERRKIEPFNSAVLNMVMHSINDETLKNILMGIKKCLVSKKGALIFVIPTEDWLQKKLFEYAKDIGMAKDKIIPWLDEELLNKRIELPVRITDGEYYPNPLVIYNRTMEEYGKILLEAGYGIYKNHHNSENPDSLKSELLPFWHYYDYSNNAELSSRDRRSLLTFSIT